MFLVCVIVAYVALVDYLSTPGVFLQPTRAAAAMHILVRTYKAIDRYRRTDTGIMSAWDARDLTDDQQLYVAGSLCRFCYVWS